MIRKNLFLIVVCVTLMVLVLVYVRSASHMFSTTGSGSIPSLDPQKNYDDIINYWKTRMHEVGAERAYNEFKGEYANTDFAHQHLAAHIYGELLYREMGLDGLSICDASFAFGCYHSFFTSAIATEGESIIPQLDDICRKKFGVLGTGCQHGLGHGALEYAGHAYMQDALDMCRRTQQVNPLFGCTSGVFMEYYTPIMVSKSDAQSTITTFDKKNPYGVCQNLQDKDFRLSCYYELGHWWGNSAITYSAMGIYCASLQGAEQEVCFQGVADTITVAARYDVDQSVSQCRTMPEKGVAACLSGVAWTLFAEPKVRARARSACDSLSDQDKRQCLARTNIMCNLIKDVFIKESCYRDSPIP